MRLMYKVVVVAPDETFAKTANTAAKRFPILDVKIIIGNLEQAVGVFQKEAWPDTEVVLSRGGTTLALQEALPDMKIINVRTSPYDLFRALQEASKHGKKIAVAGFPEFVEVWEGVKGFLSQMFDIDEISVIPNSLNCKTLEREISHFAQKGYTVIIGGSSYIRISEKMGLKAVPLTSNEETIFQSLRVAKFYLEAKHNEKEKTNQLKAILASSTDGIIAVNKEGEITLLNEAAQRITKLNGGEALGKKLIDTLPGFNLLNVITKKRQNLGILERIGEKEIVVNEVPIFVDGHVVGAVASFQELVNLQTVEQKVRRALHTKGHLAKHTFGDIVGQSQAIIKAVDKAKRFATTNSTVLITGKTGTGKEMFAQSIHRAGERQDKPFVGVNCAALPESLLESELFGYVEGAFTGARRGGKAGLFEQAHCGTIFLDEISEMPVFLQARLLRVLQEKEIMRIGDNKILPIDVRIISATNSNLEEMVDRGSFREDLYYRLNVLNLGIPSLKERKEDIPLILKDFLYHKTNGQWMLEDKVIEYLQELEWPGNIRQLDNIAERLILTCDNRCVTLDNVMMSLDKKDSQKAFNAEISSLSEGQLLLRYQEVQQALKAVQGKKAEAASRLGITRTTLYRWLKEFEESGYAISNI